MSEAKITIEEVTDPNEIARTKEQDDRHRKNSEWLESHWDDVLPEARGKYVAVSGEETFIAETPEAAWSWAENTHPDDNGAIVRYVRTEEGPRVHAICQQVEILIIFFFIF